MAPSSRTDRLNVLYEDNHVIAVYKEGGISSQGDCRGEPSAMDLTKAWLKTRYGKPGRVFLGLVHRLDRPVSGVIVFAKTSKGASRLSEAIRQHQFDKTYLALVEGRMPQAQGVLTHFLRRGTLGKVVVFDEPKEDSKLCVLRYRVQKRGLETSLLEIRPETGRRHQIRAQLSKVGCPIVGDRKYGALRPYVTEAIALISKRVEFSHPTEDRRVSVEAPDPWCHLDRWLR